jgi:hypothetical protein|tara:strand:+ start:1583 stop:1753 length:171 start_codon:yes stop_codon:yes gene_type:complete
MSDATQNPAVIDPLQAARVGRQQRLNAHRITHIPLGFKFKHSICDINFIFSLKIKM